MNGEYSLDELRTLLERNEYVVEVGQLSEDPDLLLRKGDEVIAVEIKMGNPDDPVPSGTGVQMDNQIRHLRDEGVNVRHSVLVTNQMLPGTISKELDARGINVYRSGGALGGLESLPRSIQGLL